MTQVQKLAAEVKELRRLVDILNNRFEERLGKAIDSAMLTFEIAEELKEDE